MNECTKVKCPLQAGMSTDHCADNCPWWTGPKNGDLISRAAIIDALMSYTWRDEEGFMIDDSDEKREYIEKWFPDVPAVDAVPVVRGRWLERHMVHDAHLIDEWQSALCSRCGKYHTTPYLYYFENYNYCPNCGAKMDGE